MRKLSNRWKEKVKSGMDVQYLKYADITLTDGTVLNLTSANLWANGFSFEDSVSNDSSFDIGSAIINVLNLSINNFDGEYSDYDFEGAEVICYVGMEFDDGTTEKIRICTATVVEQPEDETVTIDLTCEDNMRKFDRNYSDSKLNYPATRGQIVRDACEVCGVTLQTTSFDRDDYIVQTRPSDDALTFRQVLQWVAQIGCQWLRCDEYGRLCVKWYDTEKIDAQKIDTTYSFTPQHTDVVITGIQVTEYSDSSDEEPESYMVGTQGYVLAISDNKLIHKGDGQTVASMIAEKCVGMVFRPFESECPTDVALEAGDAITIEDRNGNLYSTYLTTTTLQPGAGQNIACNAKSAAKNSSIRYSQITQVYVTARKMVKAEKTAREKALEEFGKRIDSATGVYTTVEPQENGSKIFYLHDKPTMEESKAIWKMTSEAWGVSTDGGQTWNGGMTVDGDTIVRILNAVGVNATWINTGAITVKDANENILFQVDMDTKTVVIDPDVLIIGNMTLSEKLENMDNNIASAKNMTFHLSNDMQTITSDSDGNIPVFPTVTTTAKVMYGSSDITNDCSYTVTKSDSVTGSWDVDTHTYTVTGLSADNGWVDIKAAYLQTLSITKRFTIAKLKAGKNGVNGLDGKDGTSGVDGKTSYFHIKYSSVANPTSSSQMTDTPSTYIGTYVDYEPNDSADPKKYTWSKFEGSDGKDGIPGTNGTDGKTYYLHIAYANSADGKTGFSVSDGTNKLYIGQYTDTVKEDSADPTKYMWSKIKGEQGADGKPGRTYIIEPSCSVLKRSADNTISPNFLEFNAYYRDGDSATRYTYKGRFVIEETADGNTWTTIYRSTVDESTVKHYLYTILTDSSGQTVTDGNGTTVGIPRDITNIRCKLYASGGTTTLMDMQSVAVVIDVDNLTQSQIVEILSNDGAWKGLYYKNGQLYISFSAALGGELTLGGANNGNGKLIVRDTNGNQIGKWDNAGADITGTLKTMLSSYTQNTYIKIGAQTIEIINASVNSEEPIVSIYGLQAGGDTTYIGSASINLGSNCQFHIAGNSWQMLQMYPDDDHTTKIMGNFQVIYGTKSRVAETKNFSDRLLYCYETPTPLFGDLGCGRTNNKGIAIIDIDPIFAETVSAGAEYQVFLQKEGSGDIWVEEKEQEYFVVKGTPNLKFSWEIKCMQKGFEHLRLNEESQIPTVSKDITNYEIDSENIINTTLYDYDKEMEELINESS